MEWRDQGLLLRRMPHGESATIIEVFTETHGRHAGIVRGGASRKMAAVLQPGTQIEVTWRARLEDHLGVFLPEPITSRAHLMTDRRTLAGLNALTALLCYAMPEREPHIALYRQTLTVLNLMDGDYWPLAYLRWEVSLLEELGFGLDLTRCAVTGATEDLIYVSPRTGRAVAANAAGDWKERLLPLSPALVGKGSSDAEIRDGLAVTGHFMSAKLAPAIGSKPIPQARQRLVDLLARNIKD